MSKIAGLGLASLALGLACSSGPAQGEEGGACYPNGTCNSGLTCLSKLCVSMTTDSGVDVASNDAPTESASDVAVDAPTSGCTTYIASTIKAMRTGATNGCFELDGVVTLGVTPQAGNPRLFVQDATGGDYSAMLAKCSSTSTTHPCTVASAVASLPDSHSVTLRGTFVVTASTTLEEFFIDSVTDDGAGVAPLAVTSNLSQLTRSSTAANLRYQRVSLPLAESLVMYDWSPSEFAANATTCPYQLGFGMIAKSVSVTAGAACSNGTSQPAGQASPNAQEVLIGTDFSQTYKVSTDCRCAKAAGDLEPSATSALPGTLTGFLVFDVAGSTGFSYVAPKVPGDAAITNTVMGQ